MKAILKWLLLPGVLGIGGFFAGYHFDEKVPFASAPVQITVAEPGTEAPAASVQQINLQPFQWSQLESTDYRIYIANLRRIGCPEQTIRDIITADVDSVFNQRRQQMESSGKSTASGLAELRQEENSFLASLLGPQQKNTSNQTAAAESPARVLRIKSPLSVPALPLVLQNVDLTPLKLDAAQMEIVNNLRQKFRDEIGTAQDPSDPAYRERWLKAQHESDSLLRGMLGADVYTSYQGLIANQQPAQTSN